MVVPDRNPARRRASSSISAPHHTCPGNMDDRRAIAASVPADLSWGGLVSRTGHAVCSGPAGIAVAPGLATLGV